MVVLVVAVVAAACGQNDPAQTVSGDVSAPAPAAAAPELRLPPTPPVSDEPISDESQWQRVAGFEGPGWSHDTAAPVPVVLGDTVRVAPTGPFRAMGLARNDTGAELAGLIVTATLVAADGTVLRVAETASPVTSIRAGEPVPFVVEVTDLDGAEVADVVWSARPAPGEARPGARDLAVATYWTRDVTRGETIDFYLYRDEPGSDRAHLVFGGVASQTTPVASPRVVAAWIDDDGRVLAVISAPVVDDAGQAVATLAPGAPLDVLLVVDGAEASSLAGHTPMLWAMGS